MNNSPRGRGAIKAQPSAHLAPLSLSVLRAYREDLREEDERISYWRRLVGARIVALGAGLLEPLSACEVHRALGQTASGARRARLLSANPTQPLPALPGADDPWREAADGGGPDRSVAEALASAQVLLRDYQQALRAHLAQATTELITRYAADPSAALRLIDRR